MNRERMNPSDPVQKARIPRQIALGFEPGQIVFNRFMYFAGHRVRYRFRRTPIRRSMFGLRLIMILVRVDGRGASKGKQSCQVERPQNHVRTPARKLQPRGFSLLARTKSAVSPNARSYSTPI